MAKALAAALALPHIELDALNWEADWRDLGGRIGRDEYPHFNVLRVIRPGEAKSLAWFLTHIADAPITSGPPRT
jgi:hypothetical protein